MSATAKRLITATIFVIILGMLLVPFGAQAAEGIHLVIDGQEIVSDTPPVIIDGRTMVPVRVVSKYLGAYVEWQASTESVYIYKNGSRIALQIGSTEVSIDDKALNIDVAPRLMNGRTFVPMRFVSEALGANINWDGGTRRVIVTSIPVLTSLTHRVTPGEEQVLLNFNLPVSYQIELLDSQSEQGYRNGQVTATNVNVRQGPGLDYDVLKMVDKGQKLAIIGTSGEWFNVQLPDGSQGWIADWLVADTDLAAGPAFGGLLPNAITNGSNINVRYGPGMGYEVITMVDAGVPVRIVNEVGGWCHVKFEDNSEGWIADFLLDDLAVGGPDVREGYVSATNVNVRTGPGTGYDVLTMVDEGDPVTILDIKPGWYRVQLADGREGWIADWLVTIKPVVPAQDKEGRAFAVTLPGVKAEEAVLGSLDGNGLLTDVVLEEADGSTVLTFTLKDDTYYRAEATDDKQGITISFGPGIDKVRVADGQAGAILQIETDEPVLFSVVAGENAGHLRVTAHDAQGRSWAEKTAQLGISGISSIKSSQQGADVVFDVYYDKTLNFSTPSPVFTDRFEIHFLRSAVKGRVVMLDPGHGGGEPGAVSGGILEKNLNIDVALRLAELLREEGAEVVMTRDRDMTVSIAERIAMARSINPDLFLSIHVNNYSNPAINGLEALYFPRGDNREFARVIQEELLSDLDFTDRGLRLRDDLSLLEGVKQTAALVELGYLSNSHDRELITSAEFRQEAAQSLFEAISTYLGG